MALPSFLEHLNPARNVTSNFNQDVEPTTTAVTDPYGTTWTNLFWTEYGGPYSRPYEYYSWSNDGVNFSAPTQFALPIGFTDPDAFTGDPTIAVVRSDGVNYPREYFGEAAYHTDNSTYGGQSGIFIFGSANGGQGWTGPVQAANSNDGNLELDQPNIAVSWSTTPPPGYAVTNGFVYTAYTLFNHNNRSDGSIYIRRSRAGIMCIGRCRAVCFSDCIPSFDAQVEVVHGNVATPQVVVDNSGAVHVLYFNYDDRTSAGYAIEERVAPAVADPSTQNLSFGARRVIGRATDTSDFYTANGTVLCISNIRARHNPQDDRIAVVWSSAVSSHPQVYFNSGDSNGHWIYAEGTPLDYDPTHDQFQPGLDFDPSGNLLVGWFDTRFSPSNSQWRQVVRYVSSSGGNLWGTTDVSHFDSQSVPQGFIGDYHELWRWNGLWNNPWIGEPATPNPWIQDLYYSWMK